jgi:hypothetical protein
MRWCGCSALICLPGDREFTHAVDRQSRKHAGAWPAVRAVLDPAVRGGQLWGPRVFGLRGKPQREPAWNHLTDTSVAARLWDASRDLTGVDLGTIPG